MSILTEIENKRNKLKKYGEIPKNFIKLKEWLEEELTWSGCFIDGSTLSREEIRLAGEEGLVSGGVGILDDYIRARNYRNALSYILNRSVRAAISEDIIKNINKRLAQGIEDLDSLGAYRFMDIVKRRRAQEPEDDSIGERPVSVRYPQIENRIASLLDALNSVNIEEVLEAALKLYEILPFYSENRKTANMVLNMALLGRGFLPIIIRPRNKKRYLDCLERMDAARYKDFMLKELSRTYDMALDMLADKPKKPKGDEIITIGKLSKRTGIPVITLHYYVSKGTLVPVGKTATGYNLFSREQACELREKRLKKRKA